MDTSPVFPYPVFVYSPDKVEHCGLLAVDQSLAKDGEVAIHVVDISASRAFCPNSYVIRSVSYVLMTQESAFWGSFYDTDW